MNDKPKTLEASADGDDVLLAQFNFSDLPVTFSMRDGNQIIQEKSPSYLCTADGFYGVGKGGTWYAEDSIIVADLVPNYHLQPLNRGAGVRWAKWASRLPTTRAQFDIGDMAEASQILAKNPAVQSLDPIQYQSALIKLCEELKIRREGKDARTLPGLNHNFAPQSGGNAPPMLGAKQAEMGQQGPGSLHRDRSTAGAGGVRRAAAPAPASAGNALGGPAPV